MPEYDSGKTHSSSYSGQATNFTSGRMRRLRERKNRSSKLDPSKQIDSSRKLFSKLVKDNELTTTEPIKQEPSFQPPQKDSTIEEKKPLLETPSLTEEQKIAILINDGERVYKERDYQSAYSIFTQVVTQQPDNFLAKFYLGVSATETGKYTEAIERTQELIELGAYSIQASYFQGIAYEQLGQKEKARLAYHEASVEMPDAMKAFMRLEEEKLFGRFGSLTTSTEEESKTEKNQSTLKKSSKPSTPISKTREDTSSSSSAKSNRSPSRKREDTTFNQSGRPSKAVETNTPQKASKLNSFDKAAATEPLDVAELDNIVKLTEAVKRSAKALPAEVAEEIKAIFTPATLTTMASVFAIYVAAHATGIGQAMDIGMLIAGGIFFGLDAFTIFKDVAGFANAVNAKSEADLDKAGQHLASAVAKFGVDAVMTLLTKKVADEVGKTVDHVNQVDEVSAHSDEVNPGRAETDRVQRNEPSQVDGNSPSLSRLDEATRNSIERSLDGLTDAQKSQYLDIVSNDVLKSHSLLEFGNFGSPERFRNVLNALDSVDDVERLKRIFNEDYLNSLGNEMANRYRKLLDDIANGNPPPVAEYAEPLSFSERLKVLDEVKSVKTELAQKTEDAPANVQEKMRITARNIGYGSYDIKLPNGETVRGNFVSTSSKTSSKGADLLEYTGKTLDDGRTIVPDFPKKRASKFFEAGESIRANDSERKAFEYIMGQIKSQLSKDRVSFKPLDETSQPQKPGLYEGQGFSGKIIINSEMKPCDSCGNIIAEQFANYFGQDILLEIKYGVQFP